MLQKTTQGVYAFRVLHHNMPGTVDSHAHIFDPAFPYAEDRHYTPGPATADAYSAAAAVWGAGHVVLVQPSPYGTDNSALCAALKEFGPGRARGIAVIDARVSPTELQDLQTAGIVGVRLNLEAGPVSRPDRLAKAFETLVDQVSDHHLAVEVFADCAELESVAEVMAASPVPVILDHFAGIKAGRGTDQPGLETVLELMRTGNVWVKFSGPYRACPNENFLPVLREIAGRFATANEDRLVWGSDWPHTGGGQDRAARPVNDTEPFRTHDAAGFLHKITEWMPSEETRHKLLDANPRTLFKFDPTP